MANSELSPKRKRGVKRQIAENVALAALLAACNTPGEVKATNINTDPLTSTPALMTSTPLPPESSPTPSVPMIEVGGLKLPDPHVSNPEFFDVTKPNSPIVKFANAFGVTPEQVAELTPELITAVDGTQFAVLTTSDLSQTADFDESGTPLMIAEQGKNGEWMWGEIKPINLFEANEIKITSAIISSKLNDPNYKNEFLQYANDILITQELDIPIVFGSFSKSDWQNIIDGWDIIKTSLDQGKLPMEINGQKINYNFSGADKIIQFAQENDLSIRAQHLIWSNTPDSITQSNFSKDDLSKILEFVIKTRVLQYKGQIQSWDVPDEYVAIKLYGTPQAKFWINIFGDSVIEDVAKWANQADSNAKLVITEDYVLESDYNPTLYGNFIALLKHLKQNNSLISGVDIENNLWIFDPPNPDKMANILDQINQLGFDIISPESTVSISDKFPTWDQRPNRVGEINNKPQAQADLWVNLLKIYSKYKVFGYFSWSNKYSWFNDIGKPEAMALITNTDGSSTLAYYQMMRFLASMLSSQ
jgi:endo-1,4-beta-xylanase